MEILLKKVKIIDRNSPFNNKRMDVYIKNGEIQSIEKDIVKKCQSLEVKGACISIGWMDIGAQIGEPGFEHREDIKSVSLAASHGGFTAIAPFPNTNPVIDSKSDISFLQNRFGKELVDCFPIAAISKNTEGIELSEMVDLSRHGAVAFSEGNKNLGNDRLMLLALQYVKGFDGLIIHHPYQGEMIPDGQIHEGRVSTSLGMIGIPEIAETIILERDLAMLQYAESALMVHNISCAESVKKIKQSKKNADRLYASVSSMNLMFTQEQNDAFDSNWKMLPPLRNKSDQNALRKAVIEGTINIISSNHTPVEIEGKDKEFTYADFGAIGLQTSFSLAWEALKDKMNIKDLITIMAYNPREVLGLQVPVIDKKSVANITIFHPNQSWTLALDNIVSKSKNTGLIGKKLVGKVLGVINNDKIILNHE